MSVPFIRPAHTMASGQTDFFLEVYHQAKQQTKMIVVAATADQAAALTYFLAQDPHLSPLLFPDLELMPYDPGLISPEINEERFRCLHAIAHEKRWLIITSPFAVAMKLLPWKRLLKDVFSLKVGQAFHRLDHVTQWKSQGYLQVPEVKEPMEFALRGEIIDWFPVGQDWPLRLSIPDERLESIKTFDPLTQRSQIDLKEKIAYPAKEASLHPEEYSDLVSRFRKDFSHRTSVFYHNLVAQKYPLGMAFFLPLLLQENEELQSFFSLVQSYSPHTLIHPQAPQTYEVFWEKAQECFEQAAITYGFSPYAPQRIFLKPAEFSETISADFSSTQYYTPQATEAITCVREALQDPSQRILFSVIQAPRVALLQQWLHMHSISSPQYVATLDDFIASPDVGLCWTIAPFEEICQLPNNIWVVPYTALVNQMLVIPSLSAKGRKKARTMSSVAAEEWEDLTYVVHEDHGIAKFHGLKWMTIDGTEQEFLELEYAESGRLYLPSAQIHAITPYRTAPDQILKLHKLGQSKWSKEKEQAEAVARDQAAELLQIYAKREQECAFAHHVPQEYEVFAQEFPFQETLDQERAIAEVLHDLSLTKPMDRLICGDVGFGKTEVALRACFVSAKNKKQVLILAPTTLLAQQHYETLMERMSHWGLQITLLSRYTKKEKALYEAIEIGAIDIIVGTHTLLQEHMKYGDLGLVIVDEEHRFGVRDKERLKKIRNHVHWLSMTATPIPRTLSMSLQGLRDLSIIATPPVARRKIVTTIQENTHDVVRQAIERELFRSGQVYYLCNDIQRIEKKVELLQALCPQARIGFVHGQMPHAQMERQMNLFYQHACDVLVCTTIIETGIDVAKAHSILIEDAHEFGLAQLHQLRGRVGRSHHQAYAYCLIPVPFNKLTALAASRLEAFTNYQDLGSGYHIAAHDLELRGAGEVLGEKQSGHIHQIGLEYYQSLLKRATKAMESGQTPTVSSLKLDLGSQPSLSPKQIPDPIVRMKLYRIWADLQDEGQWGAQSFSFVDRFGNPDSHSLRWQNFHRLRIVATRLQFSEISWTASELRLGFHPKAPAMDKCIQWLQTGQLKAYPKSPTCLAVKITTTHYDQRAAITQRFLEALESKEGVLPAKWLSLDVVSK